VCPLVGRVFGEADDELDWIALLSQEAIQDERVDQAPWPVASDPKTPVHSSGKRRRFVVPARRTAVHRGQPRDQSW
jgi:hypothetical protein